MSRPLAYPPHALTRFPGLRLLALFALVLLVGCDATGDDVTDAATDVTTEVATSIANAVALDSGGALGEAATFATSPAASAAPSEVPTANASAANGCSYDATFDEDAVRYLRAVECAWASNSGTYAASYSRQQAVQYLLDGAPVVLAERADAAAFELLGGSGTSTSPRFSHTLTDLTGSLTVTGLDTDTVTFNGAQTRAATDVLTTNAGTVTLDHRIEFTYTDVSGPIDDRSAWAAEASGTLSGRYQATYTDLDGDTRAVDVTFTVTFENGALEIEVGDQQFEADPMTGELLGA